ncbi:MAG: DUF4167 domain-containing protein [Cypionkella sp.]
MRSSKSRSRSKQNRPRTLGNIINRVFDSSGPEGKVRGTPQQIIEKYQMLARDAQISNDRVAAENFLQHAEHYTRMLAEAQREMAAEQEARQQNQQPGNGNGGNGHRDYRSGDGSGDQPEAQYGPVGAFALADDEGTGLVDLPEHPREQPQPRRDENRREQPRRDQHGQNRREDRPQGEGQNRRDDRPREPRPPRQEQPRPVQQPQPEPVATEAQQPSLMPRFESPAALVAQVVQAIQPAKAPRAPRAPKAETPAVVAEAPKPRAPRAKRPLKAETDPAA